MRDFKNILDGLKPGVTLRLTFKRGKKKRDDVSVESRAAVIRLLAMSPCPFEILEGRGIILDYVRYTGKWGGRGNHIVKVVLTRQLTKDEKGFFNDHVLNDIEDAEVA